MTNASRVHICCVDDVIDVSDKGARTSGSIRLTLRQDFFFLSWTPAPEGALFVAPMALPAEDQWVHGKAFLCNCRDVKVFEFDDDPYTVTISRLSETGVRRFEIPSSSFVFMSLFIEQIIINGIGVPGTVSKYCIEFYSMCRRGTYAYSPPDIQLVERAPKPIAEFWDDLFNFFTRLIVHLDESRALPDDASFPLVIAVRAEHARMMVEIPEVPKAEPVSDTEEILDEDGRVRNPEEFLERVYSAGIDPLIRGKMLSLIVGVHALDTTTKERENFDKERAVEFWTLVRQARSIQTTQLSRHKILREMLRVVDHDVARTDRLLNVFKKDGGPGPVMLTTFLKAYAQYDPPLGYLQGMNDLFVPIILTFVPTWTDEGIPVDETGAEINLDEVMPEIFWCFESLMRKTGHLKLLADVTENCRLQGVYVQKIIREVAPLSAVWMRRMGLEALLWLYSEFVLLFKRTFTDVWSVWLRFACAPKPSQWLPYFTSAILLSTLDDFAQFSDHTITRVMDKFPDLLAKLHVPETGELARWLYRKAPLPDDVKLSTESPNVTFDLFETSWSQRPSE